MGFYKNERRFTLIFLISTRKLMHNLYRSINRTNHKSKLQKSTVRMCFFCGSWEWGFPILYFSFFAFLLAMARDSLYNIRVENCRDLRHFNIAASIAVSR